MSVYAVASGKGGVGKTTTAVALGACFAAGGRETVVVDADLGMPDLGAVLGIEADGPTLHDVLSESADVADAIHEAPGGFDVVPGGVTLEDYAAGDPAGLRPVVETLADRYDTVIVDTAAGLSQDVLVPLGLADETILVSTRADAALQDAEKTRQLVDRVDGTVAGLNVTRSSDPEPPSASGASPIPLLGTIPEDSAVQDAEQANEPVTVYSPDGPAGSAYFEVAAALLDVPVATLTREGTTTKDGDTTVEEVAAQADSGIESTATDFVVDQADPGGNHAAEAEPPGEASTSDSTAVPFADEGEAGAALVGDDEADGGDNPSSEETADSDATPEGPLVDTGENTSSEEESSRSLLNRLTGGLLG
ncbi:MAG: AAA family ATPase [Halobacteriaceae archaeon]